jgi:plasmid stabilization system protein ParE
MKNGYEIFWTDEAKRNLDNIISYLVENWTEKELHTYFFRLERRIGLIAERPLIFPETKFHKNIRRTVLSKYTTIYYRINQKTIDILTLFHGQQSPKRLKIR